MDEMEKMKEWQDNQYNPGYWTGGRIPGFMLKKKYKIFAWISLIVIVVILISYF